MVRSALFTFPFVATLTVCLWIGDSSLRAGDDCPENVSLNLTSANAVDRHLDVTLDESANAEFEFKVDVVVSTSFKIGSLEGYAVAATHDPSHLEILSVENGDVILHGFLLHEAVDNETGSGFLAVWMAPHGVSNLPSIIDVPIARVRYASVLPPPGSATAGESSVDTTIEFRDGLRGSGQPIRNLITHRARTVIPCMYPLEVTLTRPQRFTRGDANLDSRVDISDPVRILNERFSAPDDTRIRCDDAADSNDDGRLDLSDAVYLFDYLFRGGPQPAAPYPESGFDETPDDLDCLP